MLLILCCKGVFMINRFDMLRKLGVRLTASVSAAPKAAIPKMAAPRATVASTAAATTRAAAPKVVKPPRAAGLFTAAAAVTGAAATASAVSFLVHQSRQEINGTDEFSEHTRRQHRKSAGKFLSGMHSPFITEDPEVLEAFHKHFSEFSHLLPKSVEDLRAQQVLKTAVVIRPLSDCPVSMSLDTALLAVGGPPALMAAAAASEAGEKVIYMYAGQKRPIYYDSALHLEFDADTEMPTTYLPTTFLMQQLKRGLYDRVDYAEVERTGEFPWRTLDTWSFAQRPGQWLPAFKVAIGSQLRAMRMQDPDRRQKEREEVSAQCRFNEAFYAHLNERLDGQLLLPGTGSIIVARTQGEVDDLRVQQENLVKEGRSLNFLTRDDIIKRFGFPLEGIAFAEKPHDRILSPNHRPLLTGLITQKEGNKVIDATLKVIYCDGKEPGGVAEYQTPDGKTHYLAFSKSTLSLGDQMIRGFNNESLFDSVGATGVSSLSLLYTPPHYNVPDETVCGATNHASKISKNIPVIYQGKPMQVCLMRETGGACITPGDRGMDGTDYDCTIATGNLSAMHNTFGKACVFKPVLVKGCNRQVSKNGQTAWLQPYPGIHIQYCAGGGGLTRAPDLVAKLFPSYRGATPSPKPR